KFGHRLPPYGVVGGVQKGNLPKTKTRASLWAFALGKRASFAYLSVSRRIWHLAFAGCRASQGLFPQPLLISCYSVVTKWIIAQPPCAVSRVVGACRAKSGRGVCRSKSRALRQSSL